MTSNSKLSPPGEGEQEKTKLRRINGYVEGSSSPNPVLDDTGLKTM